MVGESTRALVLRVLVIVVVVVTVVATGGGTVLVC